MLRVVLLDYGPARRLGDGPVGSEAGREAVGGEGLSLLDARSGARLVGRALALEALCRKHGTELKAAAVQFCMAHPAVTVALQGARTAAEVSDNIAMSERLVPPAFWQELRARKLVDASAPLPGGA